MAYSETFLQDVLRRTDLVGLVGQYVTLKANGARYWGLCPFHQEKSPSFTVNPDQQFFYCFGCQEKGNAFGFLMKIDHLPFPDAVRHLAEKAGLALPDTAEEGPDERDRRAVFELLGRVSKSFHHLLLTHPEAEEARTILRNRGVSDEMVEAFQLGYALRSRNWLETFLIEKHYEKDFLVKTGLFSQRGSGVSLFSGRLLFPIRFPQNETVGFGGRLLTGDGPKYLNSPETLVFSKRRMLYGWDLAVSAIRQRQQCVLCEGYMDVIAFHQAGIPWAVAPLGTSFTVEQAQTIKRIARSIVIVFDSDEAGQRAAVKAVEICESLELDTFVARTKESKDPSELLEKEGPEAVQRLLESPQKGFDFLLRFRYTYFSRGEGLDVRGFVGEIFTFLTRLTSSVQQETYLNVTAGFLGIQQETLATDFAKRDYRDTQRSLNRASIAAKPYSRTNDWVLCVSVAAHGGMFRKVRSSVSPEDFVDLQAKELFELMESLDSQEQGSWSWSQLLELTKDRPWNENLVRDVMSGEFQTNVEQLIQDIVVKMKVHSVQTRRSRVADALQKAGDEMERTRLLQEHVFLNKEISRLKGKD